MLDSRKFFVMKGRVICPGGGMVDAADLKSAASNGVRVQVPPRALLLKLTEGLLALQFQIKTGDI